MTDFRTLPGGPVTLSNLRTPACFLGLPGDLAPLSLTLDGATLAQGPAPTTVDMGGAMVLPAFVDMHTHLDKGHIWNRAPNPDGSFMGALKTVAADRAARWTAEDVRARIIADIAAEIATRHDGKGYDMASAAWIVTATA